MYQSYKLSIKTPRAALQSAGNERLQAKVDFLHFAGFQERTGVGTENYFQY